MGKLYRVHFELVSDMVSISCLKDYSGYCSSIVKVVAIFFIFLQHFLFAFCLL